MFSTFDVYVQALDRFTVEGSEELNSRMLSRGMEQMMRIADRALHDRSLSDPSDDDLSLSLSNSNLSSSAGKRQPLPPSPDPISSSSSDRRRQLRRPRQPLLDGTIDDEEDVVCTSPAWSSSSEDDPIGGSGAGIGLSLEEDMVSPEPATSSSSSSSLKMIPFSDIFLGALIAHSRSCEMYQAKLKTTNPVTQLQEEIIVAAKVITHQANTQRGLHELHREIAVVSRLDHPNICRFYGVANAPASYCLLYEFLQGGALSDVLRDRRRQYNFFTLATEIAQGMAYLHDKGIIHRDLKSSNILLDSQG